MFVIKHTRFIRPITTTDVIFRTGKRLKDKYYGCVWLPACLSLARGMHTTGVWLPAPEMQKWPLSLAL
uniref:Uncharacterized protein n=1 Tax=Arundo donax TaxID=35708 RepID=A0A0A8Y929_ARUDO